MAVFGHKNATLALLPLPAKQNTKIGAPSNVSINLFEAISLREINQLLTAEI